MKFAAASTLLFAALALAKPAPIAQPNAAAAPAPVAAPESIILDAEIVARDPKKGGSKVSSASKGSSGNETEENAGTTMSPSRVLELGALGLGVMEIVRLWA